MQLTIMTLENKPKGKRALPKQFAEAVRADLIKRAFLVIQSHKRQPYGANPEAGMRSSSFVSKRRHKFKSTYGIGQSRTPRKVMSSRGTRFNWVGAFAPQTVGGRRAHPPKSEKKWGQKVNTKERLLALRSAIAATLDRVLVELRGHKVPDNYPFLVEDAIQDLKKTKEVRNVLTTLGFGDDLARAEKRVIRTGLGKLRGRKYRTKTSLLIVTEKPCPLHKSAANILGVTITSADQLNVELLAPGAVPGRLTLFTESAIEALEKGQLYQAGKTEKVVAAAKKKAEVKA